jgi:methionyl-tRNA synthetase
VVGKDITRFHCVIWPAMLMSAGVAVPRQVFGHGWLHLKGERMSKSLGTTIEPLDAAQRFGPDPLRLYLVKEITFGSDGDFSWERFEDRYNVDLANNLGNLVSRIGAMADRYRSGRLTSVGKSGRLEQSAKEALDAYTAGMDEFALNVGAAAVFALIDSANAYIAEQEPWTLARDPANADRLTQVLFDVGEALRVAGVLLLPIMPKSAAEILRRVGETRPVESLPLDAARWSATGERVIEKGTALWPRVEAADRSARVDEQKTSGQPSQSQAAPAPASTPAAQTQAGDPLTIDDFMKVDLRTAKVLAAEKVPNSRKLVKLSIDVGTEQRTLVAGIADAYEPEQLVGRTVVMVFNLKPAKLMGIESNGMVLAASPDGGKPILVGFDQEIPPGVRVR